MKASNTFDVPSQTNLLRRTSTSTPNASGSSVAEARVGAVGRNDEIVVAPLRIGRIALGIEVQHDAELARAVLQDFEQALAADADEAVPARGDGLAAKMDVDIVPVRELVGDDLRPRPGSLRVMFSTVRSEKTTPQPKVTPGALRSKISISCAGSRSFIEIAK